MLDSSVATASGTSREEGGGDGIARDVEEAFSAARRSGLRAANHGARECVQTCALCKSQLFFIG